MNESKCPTTAERAALRYAPVFQAAFDEIAAPLVNALYEVLSEVGWRADEAADHDSLEFRCEFCRSTSRNWMEIPHKPTCFLNVVHKAIKQFKQAKEEGQPEQKRTTSATTYGAAQKAVIQIAEGWRRSQVGQYNQLASIIETAIDSATKEQQQRIDSMIFLREEERQTVVLALAHLAMERPGWHDHVKKIAERMKASAMFEELIVGFNETSTIDEFEPPSSATQGDTKRE